jgi:hypothetical protein
LGEDRELHPAQFAGRVPDREGSEFLGREVIQFMLETTAGLDRMLFRAEGLRE